MDIIVTVHINTGKFEHVLTQNDEILRKSSWATAEGVCQEMDRHAHLVAIHSDRFATQSLIFFYLNELKDQFIYSKYGKRWMGWGILEFGSEQKDIKMAMSIHSNGQIMMHFRE